MNKMFGIWVENYVNIFKVHFMLCVIYSDISLLTFFRWPVYHGELYSPTSKGLILMCLIFSTEILNMKWGIQSLVHICLVFQCVLG